MRHWHSDGMDRRTLLASGVACLAAPSALAQAADPLQVQLEALRTSAGIPALGGAIVTRDGLLWSGVTGVRRQGDTAPVPLSDRWHLGSNTKAMTAVLYAGLIEEGRAAWGATVPQLFPDLEIDPAWASTTIEQLMGHRAGILDSSVMLVWMAAAWTAGADVRDLRTAMARAVFGAPPTGEPGAFSYSNAGYIITGGAIERITGEPWETTIQREIFDRFGMASAGFGAPLGDNAWGHQGASVTPKDPATLGSDNPAGLGPAGTVHATLEDYARFLRLFLTDGAGWLRANSMIRLTTPLDGPGQPYALGWGVLTGQPWSGDAPAIVHDGSNTFWLARAVVAPARGAAAICVANAAEPARPAIDGLTRALIERFPAG